MSIVDLSGQRYGRFVVVEFVHRKGKINYWKCRCDCGIVKTVHGGNLKSGKSKSCGCLRREKSKQRGADSAAHHHASPQSPTYRSWVSMKQRCLNPKARGYHNYGGRGITICKRWDFFENFLADMGERPEGKTLDRINPDGDYKPSNCRWATASEQARNRRRKTK